LLSLENARELLLSFICLVPLLIFCFFKRIELLVAVIREGQEALYKDTLSATHAI
jgi:hypothetical protein